MESASHFAYFKKAPKKSAKASYADNRRQEEEEEEQVDTNVISVKFKTLKQAEENMQMGDPFFCKDCKSCLSSTSKLINKCDFQAELSVISEDKAEEEKKEEEIPAQNNSKLGTATSVKADTTKQEKVWICEFCGTDNMVNLDSEEVPKLDDVIYLLQSAQQLSKNTTDLSSDVSTIFCIDNSGSMGVTNEIQGKHDLRHGLSEEEYETLKQFIEYGADQYLPNQTKGTTFVSRKQCVLAAIEEQLLTLKAEYPNRKVGLVTFNDDVNVIGDGKSLPETIAGDKLYNYEELLKIGQELGSKMISAAVKESAEDLIKKFEKLQESGKTALGPALLVSLGLAMCGKQGSRIILCTDGLANVGLGEIGEKENDAAEAFYTQVGILAKERGVSISVISIKGEGCKLSILSNLADVTSGRLTKVDPNEITKKFATIMKNEVIGTQAEVKLRLHQAMRFRNEESNVLQDKDSLYQNQIGNVTARTQLTFEYEVRSEEELKEIGLNLDKLQSVPFQAQIVYNSTNGDKLMRVITKTLKVTEDLHEAETKVNIKVLATRALHEQGKYASKKMHVKSEKVASGWGKYLNGNVANYAGKEDLNALNKFNNNKEGLRKANARKAERSVMTESMRYREAEMSDEDEDVVHKVKNYHFDCEEEE